jgi:hypothetical protein
MTQALDAHMNNKTIKKKLNQIWVNFESRCTKIDKNPFGSHRTLRASASHTVETQPSK